MPPEITVAIDPKLTGSGYGIAAGRKLVACGLATVPRDMRDLEGRIQFQVDLIAGACPAEPDIVVAEFPVVYPGASQVGTPNDIVYLAALATGIAGFLGPDRLVLPTPREWKGTMPKAVHHERLRKDLPERVIAMINDSAPASKRHDVYDAVGLLYWYLDQLEIGA